jgi:hypothetical protein
MTDPTHESTVAWRDLLDLLRDADAAFLTGDRAVAGEVEVAEGYRYLVEALRAACEIYLWADPERPAFVPIVGPTFKWGGDNSDSFYRYAPVRGDLTYRVRAVKGDAVYAAICVYGGPDDGRWSTRIVSSLNDADLTPSPDGSYELVLSKERRPGNWLALDDDAVAVITRDYHVDPVHGAPTEWHIEAEPSAAPPPPLGDEEVARRLRAVAAFLRELLAITPLPPPETPNVVQDVWKVPDATYGWAAKDAHYAMGWFDLADDEALVVEGRSPECAYWGLMLWNAYMQTFDYRYERIGINREQVRHEPDGSWRIVVAHRDPGTPNWLSTAGHRRGVLFFRWFVATETPTTPVARVVTLGP